MRIPAIAGIIDRRILVNYRIDPAAIASILPAPFRPKLIHGQAMGGICLIRLKKVRPRLLPAVIGITSENAAHRFAVEWDEHGQMHEGVFVPRRDTDCLLNVFAGGRLFPGEHHHARFMVKESESELSVALASRDGDTRVSIKGRVAEALPSDSIFASLDEASQFFEAGSLGYSATVDGDRFDGLELRCKSWQVLPLQVEQVSSSYFEETDRFPRGSVVFDHALLMRNIEHEWHSRDDLCCSVQVR